MHVDCGVGEGSVACGVGARVVFYLFFGDSIKQQMWIHLNHRGQGGHGDFCCRLVWGEWACGWDCVHARNHFNHGVKGSQKILP